MVTADSRIASLENMWSILTSRKTVSVEYLGEATLLMDEPHAGSR
jgi:hypothetical protein